MNGLMDRTRGGAVASGPIESLVPDVSVRTLPGAHEGGCYTLAFDRRVPMAALHCVRPDKAHCTAMAKLGFGAEGPAA